MLNSLEKLFCETPEKLKPTKIKITIERIPTNIDFVVEYPVFLTLKFAKYL
jgi:hypothetical protein